MQNKEVGKRGGGNTYMCPGRGFSWVKETITNITFLILFYLQLQDKCTCTLETNIVYFKGIKFSFDNLLNNNLVIL